MKARKWKWRDVAKSATCGSGRGNSVSARFVMSSMRSVNFETMSWFEMDLISNGGSEARPLVSSDGLDGLECAHPMGSEYENVTMTTA